MNDPNAPDMFDPALKAVLDRFDVPPLSGGFADRVLAALDRLPDAHPPLPVARPPRGRNFGWARRRMTIIGATLALGVASMSAAATGLLSDFGIRIPVVTEYVTKHLGIKPVHFWHHTNVAARHEKGLAKPHIAHPAQVTSSAPAPATVTAPPANGAPSSAMTPLTTMAPPIAQHYDTSRLRTASGVGLGIMAGHVIALSARPHPLIRAVHPRLMTTHALHSTRFNPHVRRDTLASPIPRILDPVHPPQRAQPDRGQAVVAPREELLAKPQPIRGDIGSRGHPVIPDEITHLQSPEERAALRPPHPLEARQQPIDGTRADRPTGNPHTQRFDSLTQPRQQMTGAEPLRHPEHRGELSGSPKPHQGGDVIRPERSAPADQHPFRNRPIVRNNPPHRSPPHPNVVRPFRAPRGRR